jgi:hypothetical protein
MGKTMTKKIERITQIDGYRICTRLDQVCDKTDGGLCLYHQGHSDATVAEELNLPVGSVANLRLQHKGKLRERRPNGSGGDGAEFEALKQEIVEVRAENGALKQTMAALQAALAEQFPITMGQIKAAIDQHNKLVEHLAMNRVINSTKGLTIKGCEPGAIVLPLNGESPA